MKNTAWASIALVVVVVAGCGAPSVLTATDTDAADSSIAPEDAAGTGETADSADAVGAGGFFLTGHAEAFAADSKATSSITFSVVDDLGQPVAVTVRQTAPEYRLEMLPPPAYPHFYTLTIALAGMESVVSGGIYKPGWSGSPVTDTVQLTPMQLTRGAPMSTCGIASISPYDGTMIVRGLAGWRRLRMVNATVQLTPIAGAELAGAEGGPIADCATVSDHGKLNVTHLPGGRFALLPRVVAGQFEYAVVDLETPAVVASAPALAGAPIRIGETGDFLVVEDPGATPQLPQLRRFRWDQGVVTQIAVPASRAGVSPEGRYFLQMPGPFLRYDAETQTTAPLLPDTPPDLRHGPDLGWQGAFLVWSETNQPKSNVDCSFLAGSDGTLAGSGGGCRLRVVKPGEQPVTVSAQGYFYGVSATSHAIVYLEADGLKRYDVDTATTQNLAVQLTFDAQKPMGMAQPGPQGVMTVGDQYVIRDVDNVWVVSMGSGAVVAKLPGYWSQVLPFAGETVALAGISQLGWDSNPAYRAQGVLNTKTGVFTSTAGLYAGGARQFDLSQEGILSIGDASPDDSPHDVIFTQAGFPHLAGAFAGPATFHAPCVPYIRPIAGKLTGSWSGYDTLCVR